MKTKWIVISVVFLLICGCAARSDIIVLDERVARLERKLDRQSDAIAQFGVVTEDKEQKLRSQSASLRVQIDELRDALQGISGRLEEIQFKLSEQSESVEGMNTRSRESLERLGQDLQKVEERLVRIEQYLDIGTAQAEGRRTSAAAPAKPVPITENLSENDIYRLAKQAFDQGDFETARQRFQELIKRYPKSKSADNAQFWIGEIYYREKWYEKAIVEYQKVIENYPDGNKVKSSLLKQGYAFYNIGDKDNARLILRELIRKYPDSNEANIAQRKLAQID